MSFTKMVRLAAALALCTVFFAGPVRADIDSGEDTVAPADTSHSPALDPFRALIQPVEPVAPIVRKDDTEIAPPVVVPIIPPVEFTVTALAVDGANRVAVIEFQGQTYIAQEGTKIPDTGTPSIEVKTLTDEKVVVVDTRRAALVTKQIASN